MRMRICNLVFFYFEVEICFWEFIIKVYIAVLKNVQAFDFAFICNEWLNSVCNLAFFIHI